MLFKYGIGQVDDVTSSVVLDHLQCLTPVISEGKATRLTYALHRRG